MKEQKSCPHCSAKVTFNRAFKGRWVGAVAGGGFGLYLASGLGLAGAIVGAPIAIPATLVGGSACALLGVGLGKK